MDASQSLRIFLPTYRRLPGLLRLFDGNGRRLLYDIPCRGKADGRTAVEQGNPMRDPTRPWGDAPSGFFKPAAVVRYPESRRGIGYFFLPFEGIAGDGLKAKQNGRTGLGLHGGGGNERLAETGGCIRLFGRDMELLSMRMGSMAAKVEVVDCAAWPPAAIRQGDA